MPSSHVRLWEQYKHYYYLKLSGLRTINLFNTGIPMKDIDVVGRFVIAMSSLRADQPTEIYPL